MNLKSKLQPVKGYFSIEVYNSESNELIHKYEDYNQIMTRVPFNFLSMTYGGGRRGIASPDGLQAEWPSNIRLTDFVIDCVAFGTNGTEDEIPKEITPDRDWMFSEENLWEAWANNTINQTEQDMDKYIYQTHFEVSHGTGPVLEPADKVTEGPSFPWDLGLNVPIYYDMDANDPNNGTTNPATSMSVKSSNENLRIDYEFLMGQYAGNGIWEHAPRFSEAGLYMKYNPVHLDDNILPGMPGYVPNKPLGALFSMKTFPDVPKTEACWFKVHWTIIFGNSDAEVNIITDDVYTGNFRAVIKPMDCTDPGDNSSSGVTQTIPGFCEV